MQHGKNYRKAAEQIDHTKLYEPAAAIKLEMLWNLLANTHDFSLLCGYAMGQFYKDATIDEVCRHHTHVVSDSGAVARNPLPV